METAFFSFKNNLLLLLIFSVLLLILTIHPLEAESEDAAIISRFQQYLQINTAQPSPLYQQSADFLISQAKSIGLEFQSIEFAQNKPLVLLKWPGSDPTLPSILLNSHTDVVPVEQHKWAHHPFGAHVDSDGNIFARGSQDMKCVGMQYLEAIRRLKSSGFHPLRSVYLSFVPDEEIGSCDGAKKFADSDIFNSMNVGIALDEGKKFCI
jgi:aminoacylase